MKTIFTNFAVLSILIVTQFSCQKIDVGPGLKRGKGPIISQERYHTDFSGIDLKLNADVYLSQESDYSVRIEAQENIHEIIETNVVNGVMVIDNLKNTMHNKRVKIYLTAPTFNNISINGSGDIFTSGKIITPEITCNIKGSGDLTGDFEVEKLNAKITGSGEVKMEGKARETNLDVDGSGDFLGRNFQTETLHVKISGSGDVEIAVSEEMSGTISGSGDLLYSGTPRVAVDTKGSGDLKRF